VPQLYEATRHIRRVLGPDSWIRDGARYRLTISFATKLADFERGHDAFLNEAHDAKVRLAAAQAALALVGNGDYLTACDGPWLSAERTLIHEQAIKLAATAAELASDTGARDLAIKMWETGLRLDSFNETLGEGYIRCLVRYGRKQEAHAALQALDRRLERHLGVRAPRHLWDLFD
jgi:DNA-binding SARP family transcriptional activator